MDRERLTELLRTPSTVTESDMDALRSMAERFPWFSGARLLLAVGEHRNNDLLADDSRIPAAFLSSREVLFQLVKEEHEARPALLRVVRDEPEETAEEPVAEEQQPVVEAPQVPEPVEEPAMEELVATIGPEATVEPEAKAEPEEVPAAAPAAETEEPEPTGPAPEEPEQPAADVPGDALGRMYEESIRASSYDLSDWASPAPTEAPEPPAITPVEIVETPVPALVSMAEPASPREDLRHGRFSFTEWLEHGTASGDGPETPPAPAPPEPAPTVVQESAMSQQELLDRFIQQDTPPPPKEKVAFFNPQQVAKQSLKDDGLVSETLARIHEKQGNLAKAKEVYDRLAARDPEKSVYFAALSKALEARMNK